MSQPDGGPAVMGPYDLTRRALELQAAIELVLADDPRMYEAYRLIGEAARRMYQVHVDQEAAK